MTEQEAKERHGTDAVKVENSLAIRHPGGNWHTSRFQQSWRVPTVCLRFALRWWVLKIFAIYRPSNGDVATAFFVSGEGHILTCAHFLEGSNELPYAVLDPQRLVPVTPIALSLVHDLALLRVDVRSPDYLSIADELPNPGTKVTACGYTGLDDAGHITIESESCRYVGHRDAFSPRLDPQYAPKTFSAIFTTPYLRRGFSGAPILDSKGAVIGLHSLNVNESNLGRVAVSIRCDVLRATVERRQSR